MGETATSNPSLQVSVSFGRFENDSLSWEKWSTFSPNKYMEEVEKCATPGSVAQKKAYFEAHYKKIAARKAELLAQEKQMEKDSSRSEDQNGVDLSGNACGTDAEFDVSNAQGSIEGDEHEIGTTEEVNVTSNVDNLKEEVEVMRDYQSSSVEVEKKEVESGSEPHSSYQIDEPQEDLSVKLEERLYIEDEDVKEISHVVYKETEKASEVESKDVKLDHPKESKVSSVNKVSDAAKTKKKATLPTSKASQVSTSKPTSTPTKTLASTRTKTSTSTPTKRLASTPTKRLASTPTKTLASNLTKKLMSTPTKTLASTPTKTLASTPTKTLASAASTRKGNSPSSSRKPITSSVESRKVANKSLHMSLSLGPTNPDPTPHTTMRKSLIMEQMGDKDIVKRAFKTFQNHFNQPKPSDEDKSLVTKQVPSKGTVSKVPASTTARRENGRPTKVESMEKRSGNAARTTLGAKSDIRAEKGKAEDKEAEMKRLKHNFKATPPPTFERGQKVSKTRPEKGQA